MEGGGRESGLTYRKMAGGGGGGVVEEGGGKSFTERGGSRESWRRFFE